MSPQIPVRLIRQVRHRAGDVCEYYRLPQASQEATFHVDHVSPRSHAGPTELANLALACVGDVRECSTIISRYQQHKGDWRMIPLPPSAGYE